MVIMVIIRCYVFKNKQLHSPVSDWVYFFVIQNAIEIKFKTNIFIFTMIIKL